MKVPYTNETDRFMHIGGVTIPPNDTRDVDPRLLPGYQPVGAPESHPVDSLAELLKKSVAVIIAAFGELSAQDLDRLEQLENERTPPRKSLIEAISIERLTRATADEEQKDGQAGEGEQPPAGEGSKAPEGGEGSGG